MEKVDVKYRQILQGRYVQGIGRAQQFGDVYRPAFGCPMVATFNVQVDRAITDAKPTKTIDLTWPGEKPKRTNFWLCQINGNYAWALRWDGTKLPPTRIEFVSKRPLPEQLKAEPLKIEVFEQWSEAKIKEWAGKNYQWQGFSWLPRQRVDSENVWGAIKPHADWSGMDVLDIGSHYGYYSFRASEMGACVRAIEPNDRARITGELIAQHIEMQDVQFQKTVSLGLPASDITLYLSVHHQWDPTYEKLENEISELVKLTKEVVFVELILPPMFGRGYTPEDVDSMVGGEILETYKHGIRGVRRIYKVEGKAK